MSFLKKIFKKKKKVGRMGDLPPVKPSPKVPIPPKPTAEPRTPQNQGMSRIESENIRAKLDLIITDISSLKIQNQNILERLKKIEETSKPKEKPIRYY